MAGHSYTAMTQIAHERSDEESFTPVPKAAPEDTPHASKATIEELNPTPQLMKWFYVGMMFVFLSKCQAKILPPIVNPPHKNVIFHSPIGSGKSIALLMAMLFRVEPELKRPQAICIVPNSYLAIQNMDLLSKMGKHSHITCVLGVPPYKATYISLAKMPPVDTQVIIGTPVTIHKWIAANKLVLDDMKMLLIDDVDRVLAEPGFKDNVVRIMKDISKKHPQCQVIMCSTNSSDAVEALVSKFKQVSAKEFLSFTREMEVPSLDSVKQYKVHVPDECSKFMVIKNNLLDVIAEVGQTIIFHTKENALMLCETLKVNRFMYRTLDGADTREQREKILEEFKEKRIQVLLSTKPLDWVFDPSQVGLVVFSDLSVLLGSSSEPDLEQYSHCIGRAGQFDRKGAVFSLMYGDMDKKIMEKIETLNNVTKVLWNSDVQFEDALKKAGL